MLRTRIHVNLKSEPIEREMSAGEWLRSLFGREIPLASGREQMTLSSYGLVKGLVRAFERVGITNLIAFVVDDRDVYLDAAHVDDDLHRIEQEAARQRIFDGPFDVMHVVLEHHAAGLHTLIDVEVHREVLLRQPEMRVDVVTRLDALRPKHGERLTAYVDRVRAWARDSSEIEMAKGMAVRLAAPLIRSLDDEIPSSVLSVEQPRIEIVLPKPEEVRAFPGLSFGGEVPEPRYDPRPERATLCKYGVPVFSYYYEDPYADLLSWVLVHELFEGTALRRSDVLVTDKDGDSLLTGVDAGTYPLSTWGGYRAVSIVNDMIVATPEAG